MHELPVTQNILDIALDHAHKAQAKRVLRINLTIGELSSIIDDSVQFYWEIIAKGTIAEGAVLNFNSIPTLLECHACHTQYKPVDREYACPNCQSLQFKIVHGQEFFLESIDIE